MYDDRVSNKSKKTEFRLNGQGVLRHLQTHT